MAKGLPVDGAGSQGLDSPADVLAHGCAAEGQEEVEFPGEAEWYGVKIEHCLKTEPQGNMKIEPPRWSSEPCIYHLKLPLSERFKVEKNQINKNGLAKGSGGIINQGIKILNPFNWAICFIRLSEDNKISSGSQ